MNPYRGVQVPRQRRIPCIRHTAETVHPDDDMRARYGTQLLPAAVAHGEPERYLPARSPESCSGTVPRIGVDDTSGRALACPVQSGAGGDPDAKQDAKEDDGQDDSHGDADVFEVAFGQIYLRFHRRDAKRSELGGASRAVLTHLSLAGPLTVGEMADHLDRAQSVVSDIASGLEAKGLLAREKDPADRRRTLVWLTDDGLTLLAADRRVLSVELLGRAVAAMSRADRAALLRGVHALLATDSPTRASKPFDTKGER